MSGRFDTNFIPPPTRTGRVITDDLPGFSAGSLVKSQQQFE